MSRYSGRLRALEQKLAPPERARYVSLHIIELGTEAPPDWAVEVLEPHTQGSITTTWRGKAGDAAMYAAVNYGNAAEQVSGVTPDQWYRVTPQGVEPIERPVLINWDMTDDDPTEMPRQVNHREAIAPLCPPEATEDITPRAEMSAKPSVPHWRRER